MASCSWKRLTEHQTSQALCHLSAVSVRSMYGPDWDSIRTKLAGRKDQRSIAAGPNEMFSTVYEVSPFPHRDRSLWTSPTVSRTSESRRCPSWRCWTDAACRKLCIYSLNEINVSSFEQCLQPGSRAAHTYIRILSDILTPSFLSTMRCGEFAFPLLEFVPQARQVGFHLLYCINSIGIVLG